MHYIITMCVITFTSSLYSVRDCMFQSQVRCRTGDVQLCELYVWSESDGECSGQDQHET